MGDFQIPVTLILYNRPDKTRQLVDALGTVRPSKLYVIADGPRADKVGDDEKCTAVRAVIDEIEWSCTIHKDYSKENLGVHQRIISGLANVFNQEDETIILEDDCLPDPTFFPYCQELLRRYRDNKQVMMISGFNPIEKWKEDIQSYHFVHSGSHWGWATWKWAWNDYQDTVPLLQDLNFVKQAPANSNTELFNDELKPYRRNLRSGKNNIWDLKWTLSQLILNRLSIVPSLNLVTNTGFGPGATHTRISLTLSSHLERYALPFPLRHPAELVVDREFEEEAAAWRRGQPNQQFVINKAENLLVSGRPFQALALVEAGLRGFNNSPPEMKTKFILCKVRALVDLGKGDRAKKTAVDYMDELEHDGRYQPNRTELEQLLNLISAG